MPTCANVIGGMFLAASFLSVSLLSRRSTLVPISSIGVCGQWWLTSGYHCARGWGRVVRTRDWGWEAGQRQFAFYGHYRLNQTGT